jgi:hypothetical protein
MVDESRIDDVENALHDAYFTTMLTLRDAQDPSKLYLSVKKFQSLFPGRKPDFLPAKEAPPETPAKEKPALPPAPAGQASQAGEQ